ncbi:MAG: hypothetical protein Q9191_000595 [Dirinaria sp. TL-2023a]
MTAFGVPEAMNIAHPDTELLPNMVDRMANTRPDALYAKVPASPTTFNQGYISVSYRDLANAVNGVAWLLHHQLGKGVNHDAVAYIGPNDLTTLINAIANQSAIVTLPAEILPCAEVIVEALKHVHVDAAVLDPPSLESIAADPEMLEFVTKNIKVVTYGGADISKTAGEAFTSRTQLFDIYGATETASFPTIYPSGKWPADEWNYIRPQPELGIDFRAVDNETGVCEAILVRKSDLKVEQPVFKMFPDLTEYSTKDLFAQHPSRPGLWTYKGRKDNVLVLKNTRLCSPDSMELSVSRYPDVRAALMIGTARLQSALLIEPVNHARLSVNEKDDLVDGVWPLVQEANKDYRRETQISKSHIHVLDHDQPMSFTAKGTIRRAETLKRYESVVDELYAQKGDHWILH